MTHRVTFVHAADLHLGAPFARIDASDARVRATLLTAAERSLEALVDLCVARGADFLALAGDVYDSGEKNLHAQFAFQRAMRRLGEAGIRVFVARGNHDPASGWSAGLRLPDTVHHFSAAKVERCELAVDGEVRCVLYGRSYARPAETDDLAAGFRRDAADPPVAPAVAVLHANVGGDPSHLPYAPCSVDELRASGMDYWALGHIHKPGRVCEIPRANYAGSPQGLDPGEDGPHGCFVVTLEDGVVTEEFVELSVVRWSRRSIALDETADVEAVRSAIGRVCAEAREGSPAPVALRLELTGRTDAHRFLAHERVLADLLAEVRSEQLAEEPWVWIDTLSDVTAAPIDPARYREGNDLLGDLVRSADAVLSRPGEAERLLAEVLGPVANRLGSLDGMGLDAAILVTQALETCLDRFGAEEV